MAGFREKSTERVSVAAASRRAGWALRLIRSPARAGPRPNLGCRRGCSLGGSRRRTARLVNYYASGPT